METSDTALDMLRGARSRCFLEMLKFERANGSERMAGNMTDDGYRDAFRVLNQYYVATRRRHRG